MSLALQCPGTLLWYDVPGDDRFEPSALCLCSHCGAVFVSGSLLDERHHDSPVTRVD